MKYMYLSTKLSKLYICNSKLDVKIKLEKTSRDDIDDHSQAKTVRWIGVTNQQAEMINLT